MSRSGYSEDCDDNWQLICWRGAVASALRGKRGQAFLKELIAALDAMPEKELIGDSLVTADGQYCALGVVGAARGIDLNKLDPDDPYQVAKAFGIAQAMAQEIVYENDEYLNDYEWVRVTLCGPIRPWEYHERSVSVLRKHVARDRWKHMRDWAESNLIKVAA